jgi:hypothetical protein
MLSAAPCLDAVEPLEAASGRSEKQDGRPPRLVAPLTASFPTSPAQQSTPASESVTMIVTVLVRCSGVKSIIDSRFAEPAYCTALCLIQPRCGA